MIAGITEGPGTFNITQEGIKLVALDPMHMVLVAFNLLPHAFDSYQVDEESRITVDVGKLTRVLQRGRANDRITLRLDGDRFTIIYEGNSIRTLDIPLLAATNEDIQLPQMDFLAKAELAAEVLADGIKDADPGSASAALTIGPQGFRMETRGENGDTSLEVKRNGDALVSVEAEEEIRTCYATKLLEKTLNGESLAPTVRIGMGKDCPLRIDYAQPDRMNLSFIVAPLPD